jgi:hypothetical protein
MSGLARATGLTSIEAGGLTGKRWPQTPVADTARTARYLVIAALQRVRVHDGWIEREPIPVPVRGLQFLLPR